jgi:hypothetical protein
MESICGTTGFEWRRELTNHQWSHCKGKRGGGRKKERKKERKEEERERRVGALFCVEVMPYPSMLRSHARKDGVTP